MSSSLSASRLVASEPHRFDHVFYGWMARNALTLTRLSLGVVFLWFGALKFLPVVLPIDRLAETTLMIVTFHLFRPETCLHVLAFFECVIGLGFLSNKIPRITLVLIFLQMPGTFLPLLLLRQQTWIHFPYLPTFEGQYILKNFVLISAALVVGAATRGGKIIANPVVAARAEQVEIKAEEHAIKLVEKNLSR